MKGLIIYKTRTGTAGQYARWIAEETGFEAVPVGKARKLEGYDVLVLGSCIRMYKPSIAGWIVRNWARIGNRKLVLFTTSGAPNTDPDLVTNFEKAFPENIRSKLTYFPMNGKMIFRDLPWLDRKLMEFGIRMTEKSNPEEAKKMAQEFNRVNRDDILPLVEHLKAYQSGLN